MDLKKICQSCSMPLDNEMLFGTEKDGSKNQHYCRYCYQNGTFVNPDTTLEEMTAFMTKKMQEMGIGESIVKSAVNSLPFLDRWRTSSPAHV
jgi:hypothetical protein